MLTFKKLLVLYLLTFEAITELGNRFRQPVEEVDPECPRMCQSTLKKTEMKGFPLASVNQELDRIKVSVFFFLLQFIRLVKLCNTVCN